MTTVIANVAIANDTWGDLVSKLNDVITHARDNAVTNGGANNATVGDVEVHGEFYANVVSTVTFSVVDATFSNTAVFEQGVTFGSQNANSEVDFTNHILLHADGYGFTKRSTFLNYIVPLAGTHKWFANTTQVMSLSNTGLLTVDSVTANNLIFANVDINILVANDATIETLTANNSTLANAEVEDLISNNATIETLTANIAIIETISSNTEVEAAMHFNLGSSQHGVSFDTAGPDGFGINRISWNDGQNDFSIFTGGYSNGTNPLYALANSGAVQISSDFEDLDAVWRVRVAEQGTNAGDTITWASTLLLSASAFTIDGNEIWHAGNDGPGSTLDSDTVDGQHSQDILDTASAEAVVFAIALG